MSAAPPHNSSAPVSSNFLRQIMAEDRRTGKYGGRVVTRFPPEPNGYLHIGHAKSICLNFGVAAEHGGRCHLRFDDTNPNTEDVEYVDAIQADVRWLGFDWGEHRYFASDYFERLHGYAVELVRRGRAYVCDLSSEEIAAFRGTLTEPGRPSPYRDRPVEESLDLFARLNLTYTVMSKRRLRRLVLDGHVAGWDDPRMPTLSGLRRRGYTPDAIRAFCEAIGVAKRDNWIQIEALEHAVREDLNRRAP